MQLLDKFRDSTDNMPDAKRKKLIIGSGIILAVVIAVSAIMILLPGDDKKKVLEYEYNEIEQQIVDEVKAFLALYIELPDDVSAQIADAAVQDYNIVMSSNIDIVNEDHTNAIKQRIRAAMLAFIENAQTLTDEELDGLAAGIAEIILNAILGQVEAVTSTSDVQEYIYLAESIQEQINELSEQKQKMKISIQAEIPGTSVSAANLDAESLLAAIDTMTDSELQELARALGISLDELQALINANNTDWNKLLEDKFAALKKEIEKEVKSEIQTASKGNNGTNGTAKNGIDGKDGKDGTDGENGEDGKTTYIAYADDISGSGFSLTPTETSRFVGTCITTASSQPQDYASYSNWQVYRTYIITTTVDENNVTTVHID